MESEKCTSETTEQITAMTAATESTRRDIAKFEKVECDSSMVEPTVGDRELVRKLQAVEQRLLKIKDETDFLNSRKEVLENQLKRRIGFALGIRGLATWKSNIRRMFNQELLFKRNPELYGKLLDRFHCIDTKAWKEQQPEHYKEVQQTYFVPAVTRSFKIVDN
jgi:hypothetical protein